MDNNINVENAEAMVGELGSRGEPRFVQLHPGHPRIVALADRLGVKPLTENSNKNGFYGIRIACGPNGSEPFYAIEDLAHAFLDKIEGRTNEHS